MVQICLNVNIYYYTVWEVIRNNKLGSNLTQMCFMVTFCDAHTKEYYWVISSSLRLKVKQWTWQQALWSLFPCNNKQKIHGAFVQMVKNNLCPNWSKYILYSTVDIGNTYYKRQIPCPSLGLFIILHMQTIQQLYTGAHRVTLCLIALNVWG